MYTIQKHFQNYAPSLPHTYEEGIFGSNDVLKVSEISKIIEDHKWLSVAYSVHCAQLMGDIQQEPVGQFNNEITYRIEVSLLLADFFEHIYKNYMYEKDDLILMRQHQVAYRQMLQERGKSFTVNKQPHLTSVSKVIHDNISVINRYRLFTLRIRRMLIVLAPVLHDFEMFCQWMKWVEDWTASLVAYLAWMNLLPRLLKNLFLLGKHTIPITLWMNEKEMSLAALARFKAQLERHWFELLNDLVTVSVGLVNCFVLVGAANAYLGVGLLAFDVVLAAWRGHYELKRLQEIKAIYVDPQNETETNYLVCLEKRIAYEELRHEIAIANTILLVSAGVLTSPAFALSLIVPLLGASLAVITTIVNFTANNAIEKYRPNDRIVYTPRSSPPLFSDSTALGALGVFAAKAHDTKAHEEEGKKEMLPEGRVSCSKLPTSPSSCPSLMVTL